MYHPELRDRIKDPLTSFFRNFDAKMIFESNPDLHWVIEKLHTSEKRDLSRRQALGAHDGDLWIFAYGSLMWDPAFVFEEVRRAVVRDRARRFILKDVWGGRGTLATPGLMAALDTGDGCEGLAFRVAHERIDTETDILWRREMVAPGYLPTFVAALVDGEPVRALTFVADYAAEGIIPDITYADQVTYCATGAGLLGTSRDYLSNIVGQFGALGVIDEYCTALLRDVDAYIEANPNRANGAAQ